MDFGSVSLTLVSLHAPCSSLPGSQWRWQRRNWLPLTLPPRWRRISKRMKARNRWVTAVRLSFKTKQFQIVKKIWHHAGLFGPLRRDTKASRVEARASKIQQRHESSWRRCPSPSGLVPEKEHCFCPQDQTVVQRWLSRWTHQRCQKPKPHQVYGRGMMFLCHKILKYYYYSRKPTIF